MIEKEFYADRLSYRLENFVRRIIGLLWGFAFIFGVATWLGKRYEVKVLSGIFDYFQRYSIQNFTPGEHFLVYTSPVWATVLIGSFPRMVRYLREYLFYPGKNMNASGISLIRRKLATTRGTTRLHHYVFIDHPYDRRLVPVQVDKEYYFQFLEGDRVAVRFQSGVRDVLCMSARKLP